MMMFSPRLYDYTGVLLGPNPLSWGTKIKNKNLYEKPLLGFLIFEILSFLMLDYAHTFRISFGAQHLENILKFFRAIIFAIE